MGVLNQADMKHNLEGFRQILQDLDIGCAIMIDKDDVILIGSGIPRAIRGSEFVAKYLDEKLEEFYDN